jgi:NAD(P)-dependent dehydrogenase (short-subunit alcohol dehydrogenase family)
MRSSDTDKVIAGSLPNTDARDRQVDLTGQVALVTGGGGGLGRAFALALARAGARVAVTARTADLLAETAELVERGGGRALAIAGDVTAPDAVTRIVSTAQAQLGPIDILVNSAGVVGPLGYDWHADPEDWWRTFEVNVLGSFRCAREVLAGMVARERGRIVNVSSGAGFNRLPQMGAYCATKAAVTQWTKILAEDTRAHGIAVFAFHPGAVRTSMLTGLTESPEVPRQVGDIFRALLSQGRDTPIERCAQMLLFLVSGRADVLSGRFIRAQDNEDELVRRAEEIQRDDLHTVTLRM